jgi:hypothetical protein
MDIFNRTVFVSGPPRSGTTIAARVLNTHPSIFNYIDDHVHECWALYYYRTRVGLVQDIRTGQMAKEEAWERLQAHLIQDHRLQGVAPSSKTKHMPDAPPPLRPGQPASEADKKLRRHSVGFDTLPANWRLCLKSPEISFVLPQMAELFPEAVFVLAYRPVVEIAESMVRKGRTVKKVAVYQRRWREEKNSAGSLAPPPGIPEKWQWLWNDVSDFKRCAIYAASYLESLVDGLNKLDPSRFFVYNHSNFRTQPEQILQAIAAFLKLPAAGFNGISGMLDAGAPHIPVELTAELSELEDTLKVKQLETSIKSHCVYPG